MLNSNNFFKNTAIIIFCLSINNVQANAELNTLSMNSKYWVMANGGYGNRRYSELDQINFGNVRRLKLYKKIDTGIAGVHAGQPLVIPGKSVGHDHDVLIVNTPFPNKVMAFNLNTYDLVWEYIPVQNEDLLKFQGTFDLSLGLAYVDGKIILQQRDTKLVVLDAFNGNVIWSVQNGNPLLGESNINAPLVVKDMIITGNDGSEFGVRGHLSAYHINTGQLLWRAYSTGTDQEVLINYKRSYRSENITRVLGKKIKRNSSVKSWKSREEYMRGGGTTEGWYSYDPELELIYYGTGAPGTGNPYQREGDNKWSNSIIARDANTGIARWIYQMTPHDSWLYTGINEMTLLDIEEKGENKKLLIHFDQNGFVYKLDRANGKLISAEKYHEDVNWADKINLKNGRPVINNKYNPGYSGEDVINVDICPASIFFGSNKGISAFHVKKRTLFTAINNVCMVYQPESYAAGGVRFKPGRAFFNAYITPYPAAAVYDRKPYTYTSKLIAWDPINNNIKWEIPEQSLISGGIISTKGNLVFYGTTDGIFNAINVDTGKILWAYDTNASISGGVSIWMHRGKQYIGFMTGDQDNLSQGYIGRREGRLYIFTLGN